MKTLATLFGLFVMLSFTAACADRTTIQLTGDDLRSAQNFARQREDIMLQRQKATNEYQAACDRLTEEMATVNLNSQTLTYQLKKKFDLNDSTNYKLDESKGELVRQEF